MSLVYHVIYSLLFPDGPHHGKPFLVTLVAAIVLSLWHVLVAIDAYRVNNAWFPQTFHPPVIIQVVVHHGVRTRVVHVVFEKQHVEIVRVRVVPRMVLKLNIAPSQRHFVTGKKNKVWFNVSKKYDYMLS